MGEACAMRKIYFGTEEEILAIRIGEKTGLTKQTVLDTKWKK